jgi:signal transduction histidine kinase
MLARTSEIISRQVIETLIVEADGLAAIAETAGPAAAVNLIARRAKDGDGRLYLVVSATGTKLGGNLDRWPSQMPPASGGATSGGTFEYASGSGGERKLAAGVSRTLAGDLGLVVARDLELQRDLARQTRWLYLAGFGALAIAGLVAGLLASRLTMGRIGEITATSDQIMSGDMSRRVPLSGSGDELDRLAGNLNQMLDRIESLMAGLREVSDNIAHDLKTPLTRLRTRAEAALRGGDGAQAREGLGRVIEDADELIKTFNALLLIARLEAGAVEGSFETFDLTALVQDVAELYEPVAEEAQLSLVCEVAAGVTVEANRHLVGQAIANLIDNAIKYGARAGSIAGGADRPDIVVTLALDGRDIRIAVADRGPGIPAEDRARVLKRFVRLEASRTRPGTGLGLSLVAAVARLHGGRILLEDNAPGLRIVLILPHAAATAGR